MTSAQTHDPFRIAAGLLRNDAWIVPLFLLLLAVPAISDLFAMDAQEPFRSFAIFGDRLFQLVVVSLVSLRWRRRLESAQGPRVRALPSCARIVMIGLALSVLTTVPLLTLMLSRDAFVSALSMMLLTMGCVYALRMYFYFAAASVFGMAMMPSMFRAIDVAKRNRWAALKSMVVPGAISVVLIALSMAPAPDGRSVVWLTVASCMEGAFWLLSTYTGLGWALVIFDDKDWRSAGLDPYRSERLSTLQAQGSERLGRLLSPKSGLLIALLGLVVWMSNTVRQLHQLPAASVAVSKVWISDYSMKVELSVSDPEYNFRGFSPFAFSIASKTGFQQSKRLESVSNSAEGRDMLIALHGDGTRPQSVFLTFATGKTTESLKGADNMWLWYKFEPLLQLPRDRFMDAPKTDRKPDATTTLPTQDNP